MQTQMFNMERKYRIACTVVYNEFCGKNVRELGKLPEILLEYNYMSMGGGNAQPD